MFGYPALTSRIDTYSRGNGCSITSVYVKASSCTSRNGAGYDGGQEPEAWNAEWNRAHSCEVEAIPGLIAVITSARRLGFPGATEAAVEVGVAQVWLRCREWASARHTVTRGSSQATACETVWNRASTLTIRQSLGRPTHSNMERMPLGTCGADAAPGLNASTTTRVRWRQWRQWQRAQLAAESFGAIPLHATLSCALPPAISPSPKLGHTGRSHQGYRPSGASAIMTGRPPQAITLPPPRVPGSRLPRNDLRCLLR